MPQRNAVEFDLSLSRKFSKPFEFDLSLGTFQRRAFESASNGVYFFSARGGPAVPEAEYP